MLPDSDFEAVMNSPSIPDTIKRELQDILASLDAIGKKITRITEEKRQRERYFLWFDRLDAYIATVEQAAGQ